MASLDFDIAPRPPYRLDLTAWALKRREQNTWDRWDSAAGTYSRLFVHDGMPIDVTVSQTGGVDAPSLHVTAHWDDGPHGAGRDSIRGAIEGSVCRLLGTDIDLSAFDRMAMGDATLLSLVGKLRGMKPPRYPTLFEALTNAITCQQITLTAGLRILSRLADACGVHRGDAVSFPLPENVAHLSAQDLIDLGYSRQKARAMTELSAMAAQGDLDNVITDDLSDEDAVERLRQLYGVGRWSAEYALLRGCGRLNIFPGDDVGVRKHLEQWLDFQSHLDYHGVQSALEMWKPFSGMIYLQLVVASLVDSVLESENAAAESI